MVAKSEISERPPPASRWAGRLGPLTNEGRNPAPSVALSCSSDEVSDNDDDPAGSPTVAVGNSISGTIPGAQHQGLGDMHFG